MRTVSITEFRANLSRILDEAERGTVYRITRGGVPVARIEPFAAGDQRELDAARRSGASRSWPFLGARPLEAKQP
jgi:prevent-host-death family protein